MLIVNATLLIAGAFHSGKSVLIREGRIAEIGDSLSAAPDEPLVDFHGDVLLPGFVDVHIHGYRGTDTMRGETDIRRMSRFLYESVVCAFCPTTMSAGPEETARVLAAVRNVMARPEPRGARVLGAHMEAPFLSGKHAGAQQQAFFADPDWDSWRAMGGDPACVRLITLAPERSGSEAFIRRARSAGHPDLRRPHGRGRGAASPGRGLGRGSCDAHLQCPDAPAPQGAGHVRKAHPAAAARPDAGRIRAAPRGNTAIRHPHPTEHVIKKYLQPKG